MPLPDAITINPLIAPVPAERLDFKTLCPGSKSLTNRSLVLAALAPGATRLRGALWAEDTQWMVECLTKLGFRADIEADRDNPCNRLMTVHGCGGKIPAETADLFVGTAGTVARFITALCALGRGPYHIRGTPRMNERPMAEIFEVVCSLGGRVENTNGRLPATVWGPMRGGCVSVSDEESSQFASAMLLISQVAGITVNCSLSPYVEMTKALLEEWKTPAQAREIEFDASNAGYFLALYYLHNSDGKDRGPSIKNLLKNSTQVDRLLEDYWPLREEISRKKDLGDSVLTYVIMAAAQKRPLRLVDAANLREQECDRISAMATELNKCGVPATELPDSLIIKPATRFRRATIQTYNDHRMAMGFTVLASIDAMGDGKPWLTIENPSCVDKTFPKFFEVLEYFVRKIYHGAGRCGDKRLAAATACRSMMLTVDGKPVF